MMFFMDLAPLVSIFIMASCIKAQSDSDNLLQKSISETSPDCDMILPAVYSWEYVKVLSIQHDARAKFVLTNDLQQVPVLHMFQLISFV